MTAPIEAEFRAGVFYTIRHSWATWAWTVPAATGFSAMASWAMKYWQRWPLQPKSAGRAPAKVPSPAPLPKHARTPRRPQGVAVGGRQSAPGDSFPCLPKKSDLTRRAEGSETPPEPCF
jgi:hypothetical protein